MKVRGRSPGWASFIFVTSSAHSTVLLVSVNDVVLDQIVHAATTDASADEVTPAMAVGNGWTSQRIGWLRNYHQSNREGLAGPTREATWAVVEYGAVLGSARVKWTDQAGVLETGIWLTQAARGHGIGSAVMRAIIVEATRAGAHELRADTAETNFGALRVLRRLHFELDPAKDGRVRASLVVEPTKQPHR